MNNQKLVTLTLTGGQVIDILVFLSTMDGDLESSKIEELHNSIKTQLDLFDYNELCREIRLKSYLPYVRLIDNFCFCMSGAGCLASVERFRTEAISALQSLYLPDYVHSFLFRKIRLSSLTASRRLRRCKNLH